MPLAKDEGSGYSARFMPFEDTIAAISTPTGNGAIGIVRLSGPEALSILSKVWQGRTPASEFEARRVYSGQIKDLESGAPLDHVLVFLMKAPHSYTGEDLIEVQAHGGQRLLELVLQNFVRAGARMADPGEFTKRAFLNGRMDLTQAEAVADLIHASSSRSVTLAGRQLEGRLATFVGKLRNDLKVMRAQMEAMIDFPEDEDVQGLHYDEVIERVQVIGAQISGLLKTYEEGRYLKEGIRVAIVGKPNAGKSSLFNALLREDRSIVHPTPGTTRDLIEEFVDLYGLAVRFVDTAGIRGGEDSVESEGIRRTRERVRQSDLILVVLDSSRPFDTEDEMVLEAVDEFLGTKTAFYLYNKSDLPLKITSVKLEGRNPLSLSAKTGEGVEDLKQKIFSHFIKATSSESSDLILANLRHRTALQKGLDALQKVTEGSREKRSLEFLVADLTIAMDHLGEVTGEVTSDEILGEIFSRFCIGK